MLAGVLGSFSASFGVMILCCEPPVPLGIAELAAFEFAALCPHPNSDTIVTAKTAATALIVRVGFCRAPFTVPIMGFSLLLRQIG